LEGKERTLSLRGWGDACTLPGVGDRTLAEEVNNTCGKRDRPKQAINLEVMDNFDKG
jgi:hypothetical protein